MALLCCLYLPGICNLPTSAFQVLGNIILFIYVFVFLKFFILILLLNWGYTVTLTKVLTIYLS
jgi:hypothetical protein